MKRTEELLIQAGWLVEIDDDFLPDRYNDEIIYDLIQMRGRGRVVDDIELQLVEAECFRDHPKADHYRWALDVARGEGG